MAAFTEIRRLIERIQSIHEGTDAPILECAESAEKELETANECVNALAELLETDCPNRQYVNGHPAADKARAALLRAREGE